MAVNEDYVRERLTAFISPLSPSTKAQEEAFENAVEAQAAYEKDTETLAMPNSVASVSNDDISVTFREGSGRNSAYSASNLCPAAYAYLFNAGLIKHSLPVARRL